MRTLMLALVVSMVPAAAQAAGRGWVRFGGDGFSALYPTEPIVVNKQEDIPAGRLDVLSHQASERMRQFTLTVTTVPHTLTASLSPESFLESYRQGLAVPEDAALSHGDFQGHPAITLEWRSGAQAVHQRAFLLGDRLFTMSVGWPSHQSAPASDIAEFERSLSFDKQESKHAAAARSTMASLKPRDLDTELALSIGKWSFLGLLVVAAAMFSHRAIRHFAV